MTFCFFISRLRFSKIIKKVITLFLLLIFFSCTLLFCSEKFSKKNCFSAYFWIPIKFHIAFVSVYASLSSQVTFKEIIHFVCISDCQSVKFVIFYYVCISMVLVVIFFFILAPTYFYQRAILFDFLWIFYFHIVIIAFFYVDWLFPVIFLISSLIFIFKFQTFWLTYVLKMIENFL